MNVVGATTPDWCGSDDLRVSPFVALRASYGMLLGEDDFRVLAGNPRGKQMLHAAWLHGSGVVHGLKVDRAADGRLRVGCGLAIDGIGRELRIGDAGECLNVDEWVAQRKKDGGKEQATIDASVVASFATCPTRPVPALADPCDVDRRHTDCSRLVETVHIRLKEHLDPTVSPYPLDPRPSPYHGVRVLLGLEDCTGVDDTIGREALRERREIAGKPVGEQAAAMVAAFRRTVATDVTVLEVRGDAEEEEEKAEKADTCALFPVPCDATEVVLATVTITPHAGAKASWTVADPAARRALLATSTIQELLCAMAPALVAAPVAGTCGPRVVRSSIRYDGTRQAITFEVTEPLCHPTLGTDQVRVRSFSTNRGWDDPRIEPPEFDDEQQHWVICLRNPPEHDLLRLVVSGTGAEPVTGDDGKPLAGCDDDPPGTEHDGRDAVHQWNWQTYQQKGAQ